MSKVLKSLQLVTQSYNETPSTGTGALFASGSTMYFENATGTIYPLGISDTGGYLTIREYTGSNPGGGTVTYTWFKPDNLRFIQVVCIGGGGGGGQGAQHAVGGVRVFGGAGGGGGAVAWGFFDGSMLTQPSYTISIGAGGAGGSGSRYTGGAGGNGGGAGSAGQYTTFGGTMVSASSGNGGAGGAPINASNGGGGGSALNCLPGPGFAITGGGGSSNSVVANSPSPLTFFSSSTNPAVTVGANTIISTAGGGTGAGVDTSGVFLSGSYGASGYEWNTLKSNNTVSGNSGSANLVNNVTLLQFTSSIIATTYGLGGGGNGNVTPGNFTTPGGNGGLYGAGGGGSAFYRGAVNTSGPVGGSGSSGLCIVVEYY